MNVYDITLTCDHKMLVAAPNVETAIAIANEAASRHDVFALVSPLPNEQPIKVPLTDAGVLVWYPGPFSDDAILDEEEPLT